MKKLQKTTKIAFFGQNKAQIKKPTSLFYKTFNFTYITIRRSHSENFLLNKIFKLKFEVGHFKTRTSFIGCSLLIRFLAAKIPIVPSCCL